jgi:ABC-type lipoprotein export system ATPase subunit
MAADREEATDIARAQFALVGLAEPDEMLRRYTHELSGGQQQRVAIARALINEPAIILADEPTGNLDSKSGEEIIELLHQLHEQGMTIVMVTHDPDVSVHCQRIVRIRDGKITADEFRDGRPAVSALDHDRNNGTGAGVAIHAPDLPEVTK